MTENYTLTNTPHPGTILRTEFLQKLGLTQYDLCKLIGEESSTVCEIVNGKRGVSAKMAIKLSHCFGNEPVFWTELQMRYELAVAEEKFGEILRQKVKSLQAES